MDNERFFIAFDVETTGLSPNREKIVEIGAVKYRGAEAVAEFQTLVNPGMPIPPVVIGVHGITDEMVKDAPTIAEVLPALMDFIGEGELVAHNATFDLRFLNAALERHGYPLFANPVHDTVKLARRAFPGLQFYGLGRLVVSLGLPQSTHRALADARACGELFRRCREVKKPESQK